MMSTTGCNQEVTHLCVRCTALRTWVFNIGIMLMLVSSCHGYIDMYVTPYPARVYEEAPAGLTVLTVRAVDNQTALKVTRFSLESNADSNYFNIDKDGVVRTTGAIRRSEFRENRLFEFMAVAHGSGTDEERKHVRIIVSKRNQHAPRFLNTTYTFSVYRHSVATEIGQVTAVDDDVEKYNRQFTIQALPNQADLAYISVESDGRLRLAQPVPAAMATLSVRVLAIDTGSPQLTGTAEVKVNVISVRQPEEFCFSTTPTTTRMCWKNPMPDVTFDGYVVTVLGPAQSGKFLPYVSGHDEYCYVFNDTVVGEQSVYQVTVRIDGRDDAITYPDAQNFNKSGLGYAQQCVSNSFSFCNYKYPCGAHGACFPGASTRPEDFSCECDFGWQESNCSVQNECRSEPCQNGGKCVFLGHARHQCQCNTGYFGLQCEMFNQCLKAPCKNGGVCNVDQGTGNYTCACRSGYTGGRCENIDPCKPNPCIRDQGTCVRKSNTEWECACRTGYHGDHCQQVDACAQDSCASGGTCVGQVNNYTCVCPPGYSGDRCQTFDPCSLGLCQNNASCTLDQYGSYLCNCLQGYSGGECQDHDECHDVDCWNGTCVPDEDGTGSCNCTRGFYGVTCQLYNVCFLTPCNGHGHCTGSRTPTDPVGHFSAYSCACDQGWEGSSCREEVSACSNIRCANGGQCDVITGQCSCPAGWLGPLCGGPDPCVPNPCRNGGRCQLEENKPNIVISQVASGSTDNTEVDNLNDTTTSAYRASCSCSSGYIGTRCEFRDPCLESPCIHGNCSLRHFDFYASPTANADTYHHTTKGVSESGSPMSGGYVLGSESSPSTLVYPSTAEDFAMCSCEASYTGRFCETMTGSCGGNSGRPTGVVCGTSSPGQILNQLTSDTDDPQNLTADQVARYTHQLQTLLPHMLIDSQLAVDAVQVVSNLGSVNLSVSEAAERLNNSNTKLRKFLNEYSADMPLSGDNHVTSGDISVKAVSLTTGDLSFNMPNQSSVSIRLPSRDLSVTQAGGESRVTFISYARSQLFVPQGGFDSPRDIINGQTVMAATVRDSTGDVTVANLSEPVEIKLKLIDINNTANHLCVFWDTNDSAWSTRGVNTSHDGPRGHVTCTSSHLTSFAVLLTSDGYALPSSHEESLTYITYIGCAVSMAALVMTILTYSLFKVLWGEKSGKVLLSLCFSLLLLNVVFLVASVDVAGFSSQLCVSVAIALHYLVMSSLTWMLVEAMQMYQALVKVFGDYENCFLLKRSVVGWGVPAMIVGITAGLDLSSYDNGPERDICYLNTSHVMAYYASLVGPACLILLVNTVIFVMVARVILKPRFQQKAANDALTITPAQVRGAFTVMFLMGVPWVFGPLAFKDAQVVFSYVFCICNSLQGFLIFVFRCLFNPEAKLGWYQLLTTGTLKRRRGPIKSSYTDSSSNTHARRPSDVTNSRVSTATTKSALSTSGGGKHPHPHHIYNTNNAALNGVGDVGSRKEADFAPDFDDKSLNSLYEIPENEKLSTSPDSTTNMTTPFVDEMTHF